MINGFKQVTMSGRPIKEKFLVCYCSFANASNNALFPLLNQFFGNPNRCHTE